MLRRIFVLGLAGFLVQPILSSHANIVETLQEAAPLRLSPPVREGAGVRIGWSGGTGPFQVQEAPAPEGPWQGLGAPATENSVLVAPGGSQRFFRVVGGAGTGGTSEEEAMRATLAAVGAFVDSVPRADRAAWRRQVLDFLKQRPDIDSAGESPDGVWAITTDGIPLALWNNRLPDPLDPEDLAPQVGLAGTQIPGNTAARFASTMGAGFKLPGPRLARQLAPHGYAPSFDDAPLTSLKGKRNESVFFFNTHGGVFVVPHFGADGKPIRGSDGKITYESAFGLWSGTKIDPRATDPQYSHNEYVPDLRARRLALAFATASYVTDSVGNETPVNEWRFGITAEWVRHYLSYPKENHASIWLAACQSGSPRAAAMRSAFRAVGAEMISTWTENVSGEGVIAATSFLFDRLLGANQVQPPATLQRAFNYEDCWKELRSKGLHKHPTLDDNDVPTVTEIVYEGTPGDGAFGLFAPSIAYVLIDEISDQAHLIGIFGTPPESQRKVLIGGADVSVVSWEPRKIICTLPRTGSASAGDVQVVVRGVHSNVRRITRWTLTGTYKMTEDDTPHVIDGTMTLIFRADVGEYRKEPGNVFIRPTRHAVAAQHSDIFLEAKGVQSDPCGDGRNETVTWFGSGRFPTHDPSAAQIAHAVISLNTIDQFGGLGLAFGLRDVDRFPLKMRLVTCEGFTMTFPVAPGPSGPVEIDPLMFGSPLDELLPDGTRLEYPLPGGSFAFGRDWVIPAGSAESELNSGMKWNSASPEFPPDPKAAR